MWEIWSHSKRFGKFVVFFWGGGNMIQQQYDFVDTHTSGKLLNETDFCSETSCGRENRWRRKETAPTRRRTCSKRQRAIGGKIGWQNGSISYSRTNQVPAQVYLLPKWPKRNESFGRAFWNQNKVSKSVFGRWRFSFSDCRPFPKPFHWTRSLLWKPSVWRKRGWRSKEMTCKELDSWNKGVLLTLRWMSREI